MIKSVLKKRISDKLLNLSEETVSAGVDVILDAIGNSLSAGKRVEIRGFGSFSLSYQEPRNAHNPKTLERMVVPAKYALHFKPGSILKKRINESKASLVVDDDW